MESRTNFLDIMTVETCQNISVIIVNYLIPCLTFSKVVSSIDASDLKTIGVLLLTAVLYQCIGLFFSIFTNGVTPNPKYWLGGLIVAGTFTNAGDLPIAYITTLSSGTLFSSQDSSKGIAYCVIFLTIFIFSMFNLGGFRLIERDFKRKTRDIENGSYDPETKHQPGLYSLYQSIKYRRNKSKNEEKQPELSPQESISDVEPDPIPLVADTIAEYPNRNYVQKSSVARKTVPGLGLLDDDSDDGLDGPPLFKIHSENIHDVIDAYNQPNRLKKAKFTSSSATQTNVISRQTTETEPSMLQVTPQVSLKTPSVHKPKAFRQFLKKYHLSFLWEFIKNFARPPSASLIISIVITMIPPVRRLFYAASDSTVKNIPDAPDGAPVLGFVMDFTTFVGNAAVPFGLAMLGATMARLSIKKLPAGFWKSVLLMGVLKLVILPIIAVAWTNKMKALNWIAQDNHMALFVMIISSGVPSATSQVYLTAIFMPKNSDSKEMDCLAAYLICQYVMLLFTMTILLTYTLKNVLNL